MDRTLVYECALCAAATTVIVTDLEDPSTLVSARSQAALRDIADAKRKLGVAAEDDPVATLNEELLDSSARSALIYATCPRCGNRNPKGVAEQAKSRTQTRIIGTFASAVTAVGVWLLPWIAWVVVAVSVGMAGLSVFVLSRARPVRWGAIASNMAGAAVVLAVAWLYPRAAALLPFVLAVRFAISGADESRWTKAQKTIRLETPYR
jgi:hypothetical protein